jgi:hypothetical protein
LSCFFIELNSIKRIANYQNEAHTEHYYTPVASVRWSIANRSPAPCGIAHGREFTRAIQRLIRCMMLAGFWLVFGAGDRQPERKISALEIESASRFAGAKLREDTSVDCIGVLAEHQSEGVSNLDVAD